MRRSGIYKIEHIASGRVYVGSAVQLNLRWNNHRHYLRMGAHHSHYLQRAWNKYGEDAFSFSVLEYVDDKQILIQMEQHWIDTLSAAIKPNFNLAHVAGSGLGRVDSEETKSQKRARALQNNLIAYTRTQKAMENHKAAMGRQDVRDKLSAAAKARPPVSNESRAKSSARFKALPRSPEHCAKISAALKGKPPSPETLVKMSVAARNLAPKHRAARSDRARKNNYAANMNTPDAIAKRWITRRLNKELVKTLQVSP